MEPESERLKARFRAGLAEVGAQQVRRDGIRRFTNRNTDCFGKTMRGALIAQESLGFASY